jgi:hypothetical protein
MPPLYRALHDLRYRLPANDAFHNLKYGLGIVAEIGIAYWLLSEGFTWIAYLLFACSALMLLVGFFWYWIWFAQRHAAVRYVVGVTLTVGTGFFAAGTWFHNETMASWGLGIVLLTMCGIFVYGAWRLFRFLITRLFRVLLIAISQLGAAWRGELPN